MKPRPYRRWTVEALMKAARKYMHRRQFAIGNAAAYKAASRLGILDDVCEHMKPVEGQGRRTDLESLKND